jgi:hypothetical protein
MHAWLAREFGTQQKTVDHLSSIHPPSWCTGFTLASKFPSWLLFQKSVDPTKQFNRNFISFICPLAFWFFARVGIGTWKSWVLHWKCWWVVYKLSCTWSICKFWVNHPTSVLSLHNFQGRKKERERERESLGPPPSPQGWVYLCWV